MFNCECGRRIESEVVYPVHCSCGRVYKDETTVQSFNSVPPITTPPQPTPVAINPWKALHTLEPTPDAYQQWLRTSVPSCGDCRAHWKQITTENPPDYDNWFSWTVKVHNLVNERIGKPVMNLGDAKKKWLS